MITRVLIANRGEIARRIMRTCREMGLETVAIYSDPDAAAPHVLEADRAVRLPGSSASDTYLEIESVLGAAADSGADAVHPGYGFLSENGEFARRVIEAGLTWIGPPPDAIEIMGSKLASKALIEKAGIPTLPSTDLTGLSGTAISDAAEEIGYPILIKASAGGGGKGMRLVTGPEQLDEAVAGAGREAESSFGDGTVFIEKYLSSPRHIEIQVFGDEHGQVLSLFERDCSIQRRHQKIIEEAPAPGFDEETRARMGEAAVGAAKAVGYVGAGTVEFLYDQGQFFFLEMNTRLQVEHPVTEMVTGLDLVRLQIEVANGQQLDLTPSLNGHAIEARIYAEDPLNGFLPTTGVFARFEFPDLEGLRVDSGTEAGSKVTVHYDPMLAKVIAHAETRDEAAVLLAHALRGARIHGPATNRALLTRILEHADFRGGPVDTGFIESHDIEDLAAPLAGPHREWIGAVCAALSDQALARSHATVLGSIPSGWRNSSAGHQERAYRGSHGDHLVRYTASDVYQVDGAVDLNVLVCQPGKVEIETGNEVFEFIVARHGDVRYLDSAHGPVQLVALPRFPISESKEPPGSLHAPMPGKVARIEAKVGQAVTQGQTLVVLEAMKMEHTLRSPHAGTVTRVAHAEGDQVEAGALLVVVEGD
ncbi:MAG: biotin carboxylase N-terminal domain-containing protein [Acidimicrobiia bacterium]